MVKYTIKQQYRRCRIILFMQSFPITIPFFQLQQNAPKYCNHLHFQNIKKATLISGFQCRVQFLLNYCFMNPTLFLLMASPAMTR